MPKRRFYIDAEKKQRVQVSWKGKWQNFTVFLNNEKLGKAPQIATQKESTKFILADGSQLSFRVNDKGELESRLDGYLIPGSGESVEEEALVVFKDIRFVGLISIGIGIISMLLVLFSDGQLSAFSGILLIFLGGLYLAVAYWFKKSPNYLAIVTALFLLIVGLVLLFVTRAQWGLYAHIYYIYRLFPAFKIIGRLREWQANEKNEKIEQMIDDIGQ